MVFEVLYRKKENQIFFDTENNTTKYKVIIAVSAT